MSDIGSMVAELVGAGTPPELAARVVAQAFTAGVLSAPLRDVTRDERDENRRELARIRQQRRRDRVTRDERDNLSNSIKNIELTLRDVTRDENASLSKEDKKEEIKEERGERKVVSRGQRLPEDWQPSPQDRATADELIGASRVGAELEKFKDHWKQQPGSKGVKLDWNAAWRNWARRAAEFGGKHVNGNRHSPRRSASSDFFAGIAGVAADIAGNGAASGTAGEEIPLGRFNIDG